MNRFLRIPVVGGLMIHSVLKSQEISHHIAEKVKSNGGRESVWNFFTKYQTAPFSVF